MLAHPRAADVVRVAVETPGAEPDRLGQMVRGDRAEQDRLRDPLPRRRVDPRRFTDERKTIERGSRFSAKGRVLEATSFFGASIPRRGAAASPGAGAERFA